jgi:hypothetical protein
MSPELEKQLFNKYPRIFRDHTKSPQETSMCWGIETPDEWYDIIDTLCHALTYTYTVSLDIDKEDAERLNIKPIRFRDEDCYIYTIECPQVVTDQVKEKYGSLRFYYHLEYSDALKNILDVSNKFSDSFPATQCSCYSRELKKRVKYPKLETILNNYDSYVQGVIHYAEVATELKNKQKQITTTIEE